MMQRIAAGHDYLSTSLRTSLANQHVTLEDTGDPLRGILFIGLRMVRGVR